MNPYLKTSFVLVLAIFAISACQKHSGITIPSTLSVSPAIDTIGGVITITGSGFSTNTYEDTVRFNDTTFGYVLTASATQLTVVVPYYTAKDHIVVKVNGQQ